MTDTYLLGLDLGKVQDFTALVILKRVLQRIEPTYAEEVQALQRGLKAEPTYRLLRYEMQHLERFALGTNYLDIAKRVRTIQQTPPLKQARTFVVADVTGPGLPVFEMLKAEHVERLWGVSIHGGDAWTRGIVHHVPKRDLVSAVQVLLQNGTLKFARDLPLAGVLEHELQSFRAEINLATGHDTYEAWRERDHDDTVLALAIACWFGEHALPPDAPRPMSVAVERWYRPT